MALFLQIQAKLGQMALPSRRRKLRAGSELPIYDVTGGSADHYIGTR